MPLEDDSDWVQAVHPRLGNLEDYQDLPEDVRLDFSPASLDALEPLLAARDGDETFADGARAYIGETLMRIGGGRWVVTDDNPAAVRFDDALGLPDLMLAPLPHAGLRATARRVAAAVAERQRTDPGWTPAKQATPGLEKAPEPASPELAGWLDAQSAAFAEWSRGRVGNWDFSADSLDALEAIARAGEVPAAVAEWYLGETLVRRGGGAWTFMAGPPVRGNIFRGNRYVRKAPPRTGTVVPVVRLAALERTEPGDFRRALERYCR
ncbi:hypothetical protein Aph02nite_42680 [Actinoplanes philippinensis]|nr:hypothetical protein Aph02nite_42680 [Actinoplanes philippinensis]